MLYLWRKGIKRFFRSYFNFTAKQAIGLTLIALIFLTAFLSKDKLKPKNFISLTKQSLIYYNQFVKNIQQAYKKPALKKYSSLYPNMAVYKKIKLFKFNPNTADSVTLAKLGFTQKQIKILIHYRQHGGVFRTKKDFSKLYGLPYEQYLILKPFIDLPDSLNTKTKHFSRKPRSYKTFYFNPNTISVDSLCLLGFSERQAKIIDKLRKHGWKFKTKKDFAKLYVVSDTTFKRLEKYILLPDSLKNAKHTKNHHNWHKIKTVYDLNSITFKQLLHLGFKYNICKRILNYRKALGGYYSVFQLYDVYGISHDAIVHSLKYLKVDTSKIVKRNIKTLSFDQLKKHPYISKKLARWIWHHRNNKHFTSFNYLLKHKKASIFTIHKLIHYFYVGN